MLYFRLKRCITIIKRTYLLIKFVQKLLLVVMAIFFGYSNRLNKVKLLFVEFWCLFLIVSSWVEKCFCVFLFSHFYDGDFFVQLLKCRFSKGFEGFRRDPGTVAEAESQLVTGNSVVESLSCS